MVELQWRKPYFISPMVSIRASSLFLSYCSNHALFYFLCFLCEKRTNIVGLGGFERVTCFPWKRTSYYVFQKPYFKKSKSTSIAESNPVIFYIACHQLAVFIRAYWTLRNEMGRNETKWISVLCETGNLYSAKISDASRISRNRKTKIHRWRFK